MIIYNLSFWKNIMKKHLKTNVYCMNNLKSKTMELKHDIWLTMILIYFSLFILLM